MSHYGVYNPHSKPLAASQLKWMHFLPIRNIVEKIITDDLIIHFISFQGQYNVKSVFYQIGDSLHSSSWCILYEKHFWKTSLCWFDYTFHFFSFTTRDKDYLLSDCLKTTQSKWRHYLPTRNIFLFFVHFTPSIAIKPLKHNTLQRVKETR